MIQPHAHKEASSQERICSEETDNRGDDTNEPEDAAQGRRTQSPQEVFANAMLCRGRFYFQERFLKLTQSLQIG